MPWRRRLIAELIRFAALGSPPCSIAPSGKPRASPARAAGGGDAGCVGQVPIRLIARRIADVQERRLVERMYDELLATGTVEENLPPDDRAVRDLHVAEVVAKRQPQPAVSLVFPFKVSRARQPARAAGGSGARRG